MKNPIKKLSIEELKAKAEKTNVAESIEAIKGGNLRNCHGILGRFGKEWRIFREDVLEGNYGPH